MNRASSALCEAATGNLANDPSSPPLAAVVLLAGSVRQSEIASVAQRSLLDLPIRSGHTLGHYWTDAVGTFRSGCRRLDLPLLVTANSISLFPASIASDDTTIVRMDVNEPRGSGGALRDALAGFDPASRVLIAPGHALPRGDLLDVLGLLARANADIVIHADAARMPTGFLLLRCGVLAGVAVNGFADLKEQVLPQLASRFDVRVVRDGHPSPLAIRSLAGYIHALRSVLSVTPGIDDAFTEEWRSAFSIAEDGSTVHPTARLHDSVVLKGGRVGAGALVVRCLVGPGGSVAAGEAVFDKLIGSKEA